MNVNFSRPRALTPTSPSPTPPPQQPLPSNDPFISGAQQRPQPPRQTSSHIRNLRLSAIAESETTASTPDLGLHPAFRPLPAPRPPRASEKAPWGAISTHRPTSAQGARNSSSNDEESDSPPPAYTPRLSRARRKKELPAVAAVGAPTVAHDVQSMKKEGAFSENLKKRGGWKRLAALVLLAVIVVGVALGVGLGIGLKKKSTTTSTSTSMVPSTTNTTTQPFPLGEWSLTTFLTNVSTSCTSNAATWRCYPYSTYSESSASSEAILDWIITSNSSSDPTNSTLMISSSSNPFSLSFSNVPLTLHDANTATERYAFSINLIKQVSPTVALTSNNAADTCYYNSSMLTATMYTQMPATLSVSHSTTAATGYLAWTGAVLVEQWSSGGASVPDCYQVSNGSVVGSSINAEAGLVAQPVTDICSCVYENAALVTAGSSETS